MIKLNSLHKRMGTDGWLCSRCSLVKPAMSGALPVCNRDITDIILILDQVEGVEHESEVKTGNGSSFRRHFGQKPILGIRLFQTPLPWAVYGPHFGSNLRF